MINLLKNIDFWMLRLYDDISVWTALQIFDSLYKPQDTSFNLFIHTYFPISPSKRFWSRPENLALSEMILVPAIIYSGHYNMGSLHSALNWINLFLKLYSEKHDRYWQSAIFSENSEFIIHSIETNLNNKMVSLHRICSECHFVDMNREVYWQWFHIVDCEQH